MSIYEQFSEKELEILKARAKRISATVQGDQQEDLHTALIVHTRKEIYALPVDLITGVYEEISVSPLPCVPAFVAGVANVRGHLIPVMNLGILLDVPDTGTPEDTLVIATGKDFSVGLLVERVSEVSILKGSEIQAIPTTMDLPHPAYVKGVMADGLIFLDLDNILNDPAIIVDQV